MVGREAANGDESDYSVIWTGPSVGYPPGPVRVL